MKNVHLIMPMGGGGTRFGNKGFHVPKPLIMLHGRPFFFWATESICRFMPVKDITFVILKEHAQKYGMKEQILNFYPQARIVELDHILNGAVLTCMEGVAQLADEDPIVFNDCDHMFCCSSFYQFCQSQDEEDLDGALLTFYSDEDKYSYVDLDQTGRVCRTVEKQVISNEAICGAYYFGSRTLFLEAAQQYLKECQYQEFFVSGLYNIMARENRNMKTFPVDWHIPFGTPEEFDAAEKEHIFEDWLTCV